MKNPTDKKPYAEKIMRVYENQVTPYHFHWNKMEDIINRGGGNLVVKLYNSTADDKFDTNDVPVQVDGRHYNIPAGGVVVLTPGESITLSQRQYHAFWGEEGSGICLVGEVSKVNDDNTDNRFYEEAGADIITVTDDAELAEKVKFAVKLPVAAGGDSVSPFLFAVTLQLFALMLTDVKGIDPDVFPDRLTSTGMTRPSQC